MAREDGKLDDLRAVLGNGVAVRAYRHGERLFPNGAVVARLAWRDVSSEDNNRAFGRAQSFVAGAPSNVQFMVKDPQIFATTGGWGFAQYDQGKRTPIATQVCFTCHQAARNRDFVFTNYAP